MSSKPFQTTRDFADALDAFGADLARWPEDLRQEGSSMLDRSTEARKLLREALLVHRVLSERLTVSTDNHLVKAILERKASLDQESKRLNAKEAAKGVAVVRSAMLKRGIAAAILVGGGMLAGSLLSQAGGGEAAGQSTTLNDITSYAESFYL
ncbi:MAG TPA: hypothetical protein VFE34_01895 [Dongiaceae bacterium]|jgi:hypothetical protein|nr:hypothetical protein [Dongiaceae bacterium]